MDNVNGGTERPRTGVIIGFLIGGGVLLGLSMFSQHTRNRPGVVTPSLQVIGPDSAKAGETVNLRFTTSAALMLHGTGWMAGSLHPHLRIDDVTHMAGAAELVHINADTFSWKLPTLPAGTHQLQLFWADMSHVASGDSSTAILDILR